ncbi:hypothetical protein CY35_06G092300 [Sphagnum magellanicum]|nr:hypothetical protein CY35_06G092300 [Sphagnum magellanicum]
MPLLNGQSANATWSNLYQSVSNIAFDILIYKFQMPDLRVGTLDSLLTINDDLTKVRYVRFAVLSPAKASTKLLLSSCCWITHQRFHMHASSLYDNCIDVTDFGLALESSSG